MLEAGANQRSLNLIDELFSHFCLASEESSAGDGEISTALERERYP